MYRNQTQYDSDPFSGIQQLPYISQRIEFPFEEYLGTLNRVEENRQRSLAELDKVDMLFSSIKAPVGDVTSQQKLEGIKTSILDNMQQLSEGKYGAADPNINDKLRSLAKQFYSNPDLKHIAEFTTAQAEDRDLQNKMLKTGKPISVVGNSATSAFDANGNPINYYSGWQERLDREKTKLNLIGSLEQDISKSLQLPSNLSPEAMFAVMKESGAKTIANEKVSNAAEFYFGSPEGKQEIAERVYNGDDENVVKQEIRNEFGRLGKFRESVFSDENAIGNPLFDKTPNEGNINGSNSRFKVPSSTGAANENKFAGAEDLRSYNEPGTQKTQLKENILSIIAEDPDVLQAQQIIQQQMDNLTIDPDLANNIVSVVKQEYMSGKNIPVLADLNLLEDNWDNLKQTAKEAASSLINIGVKIINDNANTNIEQVDFKSDAETVRNTIKELKNSKEVSGFISSLKDYTNLVDSKINDVLKTNGGYATQPVALSPYHEGYDISVKDRKQTTEFAGAENFVPLGEAWPEDKKMVDVPMIRRDGNKLVFYGETNEGKIYPMDITDQNTRDNILNAYQHPGFIIADMYKNYTGINEDGTKFKLANGKTENLPQGFEIKRTIGDDSKIYYGLFKDNNLQKVSVYYDTTGESELKGYVLPENLVFIKNYLSRQK